MAHVLGIDLGGTKVLAGVIEVESGKVLSSVKKRTRAEHSQEDLMQRMSDAARKAIDESGVRDSEIERVGIGVAGQIDRQRGVVIAAPNLAGMANVALAEIVQGYLKRPV